MKFRVLLTTAVLILPAIASADDSVDCASSCSDGQAMVSYADGNNISCRCAASADMDATVPNPLFADGGNGSGDAGQQ